MSTQILSSRHYSAIRVTLIDFLARPNMRNAIWPLAHYIDQKPKQDATSHIEALVLDMYALNCKAYETEYDESCDGFEASFEPHRVLSPIELFKALEAWRYNSVYTLESSDQILSISERMGKSMYLAVDILHHLAEVIVKTISQYESAKWSI
jgi:hypothetical protein